MDFSGPTSADFANVARLNQAFLLRLRDSAKGERLRHQLPAPAAVLAAALNDLQVERLCNAPFLLMSLHERDDAYWRVLEHPESNLDLFEASDSRGQPDPLSAAVLSFLWQLAGRNPYAARLVSGATLSWGERLSATTLIDTLQRIACRDDFLEPRLGSNEAVWDKLLGPGLSSKDSVRRAAHLTALQVVLTEDPLTGYRQMRPAACSVAIPAMSVADTGERR